MKKSALILFLMFLAVYIAPLGVRPLVQPDETRYAEIGREMLQSGDIVAPRLNGVRYFEKPVFGYWLFAGSMSVFGENGFSLRLPCALAAGLSALAIFLLVWRFAGGYLPGLMAASVFLTMPMVFLLANVGILDSVLSGLLTAALCLFYTALMEPAFNFKRVVYLLGCGVLCGFAFMTKGFLAFAVPALTACAFLAWERRWKDFLTTPWIPAVAAVAVSLPWALAVHQAEPTYWHYFFWVEHIQRFFDTAAAQHSEPFYFFIPVLLGGAAIWLFLAPSAFLGLREQGLKNPLLKFCLCWLLVPFLFFSASTGKLAPYILPCFAPLAILIALGLHKCHSKGWTREMQFGIWPLAIALGVALPLLALNQLTGFPEPLFYKSETAKWIIALGAGFVWLLALGAALLENDFWRKLVLFCLGVTPVFFVCSFLTPERLIERKAPAVFLERFVPMIGKNVALVSWRDPAQTVSWVFKRDDVYFYLSAGEMDDGVKNFDDSKHRLLSNDGLRALIEERKNKGGVAVVMPVKMLTDDDVSLPEPRWKALSGGPRGYAILKF